MRCPTVKGAGTGLSWFVTIDGQKSVSPTTGYALPEVQSVVSVESGSTPHDLPTRGGTRVYLNGINFGPGMDFLDSVTYGPTGTEYTCTNVSFISSSTKLVCTTSPGAGQNLIWRVKVAGQSGFKVFTAARTSYALPNISVVNPAFGPTSGSTEIVVKVRNAAIRDTLSQTAVELNGRSMPGLIFEQRPVDDIIKFVLPECGTPTAPCGIQKSVKVVITTSFGTRLESKNHKEISYEDPRITNLLTLTPPNTSFAGVLLVIQGQNFCTSTSCGVVEISPDLNASKTFGGAQDYTPSVVTYSHTEISVLYPNYYGRVRVSVKGESSRSEIRRSNDGMSFNYRSPEISEATINMLNLRRGANGFQTKGNVETVEIAGRFFGNQNNLRVTINGAQVPIVSHTLVDAQQQSYKTVVTVPAGQGLGNADPSSATLPIRNVVRVCRGPSSCTCEQVTKTCVSVAILHYKPPSYTSIIDARSGFNHRVFSPKSLCESQGNLGGVCARMPTLGQKLVLTGDNLGQSGVS